MLGRDIPADTGLQFQSHSRWYTVLRFYKRSEGDSTYRIASTRSNRTQPYHAVLLRDDQLYPVRQDPHPPSCVCRARRSRDWDDCSCKMTEREFAQQLATNLCTGPPNR